MRDRFRRPLAASLPAAPVSGLLTEGIFDANIDLDSPGFTRVALWTEWQPMLEDLAAVGPLWSLVRNRHAMLGVLHRSYPEFRFAPDGRSARAELGEGAAQCCLDRWGRAFAYETSCRCGPLYGLEIEDHRGEPFHKVTLGKTADAPRFAEWTQAHQATGLIGREESDLEGPFLAGSGSNGAAAPGPYSPLGTLEFPGLFLRRLLLAAAEREIPLEVTVLHPAMWQQAQFRFERASERQGWLCFSGEDRILYLEAEPSAAVLLVPASREGEATWNLQLVDERTGGPALRLRGAMDALADWNRLVRDRAFNSSTPEI